MQIRHIVLTLGLFALSILSPLGSSSDANPLDSDPEDSVVNNHPPQPIPTSLSITRVNIERFPNRKPNASHWDWDPLHAEPCRPDPFVVITSPRGRLWQSNHLENKISAPAIAYRFRVNGKISFTMNTTYTFTVYDKDAVGAEEMGAITFRAIDAFMENPTDSTAQVTFGDDDIKISMYGTWNR